MLSSFYVEGEPSPTRFFLALLAGLLPLHLPQNSVGEFMSCAVSTHIFRSHLSVKTVRHLLCISWNRLWILPVRYNIINCLRDFSGVVVEAKMSQHHSSGEDQRSRIGLVTSLNIQTNVSASRLKDCIFPSHVATGNDPRTAHKSSTNVGKDRSVQVGHNKDIELLRSGNSLHGRIIDDQVVNFQLRVSLSNFVESVTEQPICQLHNIGFMDTGDLLSLVGSSEGESEFADAFRLHSCDNLE